jgi:hypothetical protein
MTPAYPWQLFLPDGVVAQHVPGSDPPRYTVDGVAIDVDVTIPDDLAEWYWYGSFFCWNNEGIAISTGTHPPPLCFDVARRCMRWRVSRRGRSSRRAR